MSGDFAIQFSRGLMSQIESVFRRFLDSLFSRSDCSSVRLYHCKSTRCLDCNTTMMMATDNQPHHMCHQMTWPSRLNFSLAVTAIVTSGKAVAGRDAESWQGTGSKMRMCNGRWRMVAFNRSGSRHIRNRFSHSPHKPQIFILLFCAIDQTLLFDHYPLLDVANRDGWFDLVGCHRLILEDTLRIPFRFVGRSRS